MSRLFLLFMWLAHLLPYRYLTVVGRGLGALLYRLGHARRRVTLTNLRLCFPQLSAAEREQLARRHFAYFGRSFMERGLLWWAAEKRIRALTRLTGLAHLTELQTQGRPVILFVPHFVGLDMGWTRLTLEMNLVSIYANQRNLLFNAALYQGRLRFGHSQLLSRQEGARRAIRAMKQGLPFYYLPDMDHGERDTVFMPFFNIPAATITGLSRLARMTGAAVLPVITRMTESGYEIDIGAPWADYPGADILIDTRRMNAFIEQAVLKMPEQYFWLHKRFKTRPKGEAGFY